jgi:hypothetical protein
MNQPSDLIEAYALATNYDQQTSYQRDRTVMYTSSQDGRNRPRTHESRPPSPSRDRKPSGAPSPPPRGPPPQPVRSSETLQTNR